MKLRIILFLTVFLLSMATPAYTADVFDGLYYAESGFYLVTDTDTTKTDTIRSGEILSRYVIANDSREKEIAVLTALYEDGALEKIIYNSKPVKASGYEIFESTISVSGNTSSKEICVFAIEDISIGTPLAKVMTLNAKSNKNELTSFALNGIYADINKVSKRVSVRLPYETDLSDCDADIKVSEGAQYELSGNDFSEPVTVSVTAANGEVCNWYVYAELELPKAESVTCDFESGIIGSKPENWTIESNSGTGYISEDPENPENNVLFIDDTGSAAVNAYMSFEPVYYPLSAKFRIYFTHEGDYVKTEADASYSVLALGCDSKYAASKSISGVFISESASTSRWGYRTAGADGSTHTDKLISDSGCSVNKWYEIEMIYTADGMVEYYVDGEHLITAAANAKEDACRSIAYASSTSRKSQAYIDDIRITHIEEEGLSAYSQDFENMTEGEAPSDSWEISGDAAVISYGSGKAVCLNGAAITRNITETKSSAGLSFDFCVNTADEFTDIAQITLSGKSSLDLSIISAEDGTVNLYYGNRIINTPVKMLAGQWHNINMATYSIGSTGKIVTAIYSDDNLVCVTSGDEYLTQADEISFSASYGQSILIDNIFAGEY